MTVQPLPSATGVEGSLPGYRILYPVVSSPEQTGVLSGCWEDPVPHRSENHGRMKKKLAMGLPGSPQAAILEEGKTCVGSMFPPYSPFSPSCWDW